MRSNCLWYALDRWVDVGGSLKLVRSTHWCIPHVQHKTVDGVLTQFVPPADLKEPWYSLFGFEGFVQAGDPHAAERGPMNPLCMFMGTLILLFFGAAWFAKRQSATLWRTYP